jgi:hypothetical protein
LLLLPAPVEYGTPAFKKPHDMSRPMPSHHGRGHSHGPGHPWPLATVAMAFGLVFKLAVLSICFNLFKMSPWAACRNMCCRYR